MYKNNCEKYSDSFIRNTYKFCISNVYQFDIQNWIWHVESMKRTKCGGKGSKRLESAESTYFFMGMLLKCIEN